MRATHFSGAALLDVQAQGVVGIGCSFSLVDKALALPGPARSGDQAEGEHSILRSGETSAAPV